MLKAFDVVIKKSETGWFPSTFSNRKRFWATSTWYETIDTVFFDSTMSEHEIKQSLVDHDGYPSNIYVRKAK